MPPTPRWRLTISPGPKHLLRSLEATRLRPTRRYLASLLADEGLRWTAVCDMAVAPLAEGVIFRSCLLPPLLAACRRADESAADDGSRGRGEALSPASASWISPLFFGVAHAMRSNRAPYGLELFWVSWCSGRTRRSSGPTFPRLRQDRIVGRCFEFSISQPHSGHLLRTLSPKAPAANSHGDQRA